MITPEVVVVAENLSYAYGQRPALADVSFTLNRGEVLGLLGPNGAGKSTCLRILTGWLAPLTGRVSIAGCDVARDGREARSRLGYVPEDAALYPYLTVSEFLRVFARLKQVGDVTSECERVIERLALDEVRQRAIAKLSRGFRQRVAIAQALLGSPDLIILDEPANGLDPWQIIELRNLIRDLARTHAVLVSSHVLAEIEQVASRVLILLKGQSLGTHPIDGATPGALERLFLRLTGEVRA